jgi:choline dehydrogenase-like flavoprotein
MALDSDSWCIIGSGPAGVACAKALLNQGKKVCMLDAGLMLESDRAEVVARLARTGPSEWDPADVARLKEGTIVSNKGLPTKLVYGSDFPYRECDKHLRTSYEGVGLRPSLARGGLSNVWGAAMMPYRDEDIADWPIRVADLAPHYEAVLKFTGVSAKHDDLEPEFPLYVKNPVSLELSRQSRLFLRRLNKNRSHLARDGISFGQARVAIRVPESDVPASSFQARSPEEESKHGCVYCGLCMYGCPYGHIYNSADALEDLKFRSDFTYESDIVVTHVRDAGAHVAISGQRRLSGAAFETTCDRVFLAAGVIPTTQILLRSRELYDRPVVMKDSQYFLLPLALTKSAGDVRAESTHTLSQLFIEMIDPTLSAHTVHLQIYSYNDLIGQAVRNALGPLARPFEFLARSLERRLLLIQGYLHSDHSPSILVSLKKNGATGEDSLELKAQPHPGSRRIITGVARRLFRHGLRLRAWPVLPMLEIAEPGRGFHSGGTFPMHKRPAELASDILGRPFGWQRVHAVDATVLPSIPATTITLSVMANAHRIGTEAAKL